VDRETTIIGVILTTYGAAIGAFMKGTIMLTSNHLREMAAMEKRLQEERERTDEERRRADRWMEFGMRTVGVTEELAQVAKNRDIRDIRDSRDRDARDRERHS
jgi:hypothetical protein